MEVTDSDLIVDPNTGVSTAVPDELRAQPSGDGAPRPSGTPKATVSPKDGAWPSMGPSAKMDHVRQASLTHGTAGFHEQDYRHPILQLTRDLHGYGVHHDTQLLLWHAMREYIGPLDAAIQNRRRLEGDLVIEAEDDGLQEALRDWWREVPVGILGAQSTFHGGDVYVNMMADCADEYGLGVGEALLDETGRSIRRLVVPNMRTISSVDRDQDGIYELYQNATDQLERNDIDRSELNRLDNRPTVDLLAFRASTETEWPYPLAWSLKQTGEAFLRIIESTINGWWRFGDPSMHFSLEYDEEATVEMVQVGQGDDDEAQDQTVEVPQALMWLRDGMGQVMDARREGKVSDMYSYVDGGSLSQEVIGQIDSTLMEYVEEHKAQLAAEVIEQTATPPWMYPSLNQSGDGLGSERSLVMAKLADDAAEKRNRRKKRVARSVIDTELTARGDSQFVGQYRITVRKPGIVSEQMQAEADLSRAKADERAAKVAGLAFEPDGGRRFDGEAEDYLERREVYPSDE